jgi:ABC-2 type transport system permease protein
MNTGIGMVMLTVAAVALLFVDLDKVLGDPRAAEAVMASSPIYIAFCVIMTCTTMASISLEGKNLWIIKTLPVTPKNIYLSKIAVNLTILAPALIDTILIGIALKLGAVTTIILVLVTAACSVFISFYGLIINLLLPNFAWTSEVVVIKQSAACLVTIFSGMAYVGVQFIFHIFMPSATLAYLSYFILTVAVDIALYAILMTYGKNRYNELI